MEGYESFLINNVSTIASLESTLRSITWFLPGRFKDAELASEALTSLLNVMSMYHDTLLARMVKDNPTYQPLIPVSTHTRFTRAWLNKSSQYKWISRTLEIIRYTELVVEMTLRRRASEKAKWRFIMSLEFLKAGLRLFLLKLTRRPLVSPPIPERDFDPSTLPPTDEPIVPTHAQDASPSGHLPTPITTPDHLKNNRVPLEPHPLLSPSAARSASAVEDYLLPKALNAASVTPAGSLVKTLSSYRDWAAEVIYILRPLIYAGLLVNERRAGRKTKRPLIILLILELVSRNLRRAPPPTAELERGEYAKRDRDMFWYLLRGAVWDSWTKPKLEGFVASTSTKPLLGLFGSFVHDWIPLIDEYHYYTAP